MNRTAAKTLIGVLLSSLAAGLVVSAEETAISQVSDSQDISLYREIIQRVEGGEGAYSSELPEKLLSLGLALQQQGRHAEAVTIFKRGTHLARINDGLYSAAQIPMIRGEIGSHIALGELVEADERQQYMHKVQQRSLSNPDTRTQALMQQARWQYNAYRLGIGEQPYNRLLNMWDLYRGALTDIAEREGDTSVNLLSPLNGLLQTQYLISGYSGEQSSSSMGADTNFGARQQQNRFNAYRSKSFQQGSAVIRAIYDIEKAQTDEQFLATAEALVMLGDWMLWHGEYDSADQTYRQALGELAELNDAEQQVARLFSKPVPLPAMEGINPLPPTAAPEEADILVEFGVSARGRVIELERVDETDENKGSANRFLRLLRATPFRPRVEMGELVSTEKRIHAYKISN
ncbi:MAG: hypothetical protein V7754_12360 [Halioglobus sp.]